MIDRNAIGRISSKNPEVHQIQRSVQEGLDALGADSILAGHMIVADVVVGDNIVNHKLARLPVGYILCFQTDMTFLYHKSMSIKSMTLSSAAAATIKLWVF